MTNSEAKQWQLTAITEALGDLELKIDNKLTVGRGQDNDVVLGSKQVSRQHAELTVSNDELLVQDLGSSNGTLVNDTKLEPNIPTTLNNNDVVTFAAFSFKVSQASRVVTEANATSISETAPIETESEVVKTERVADTPVAEIKPTVGTVEKEPLTKKTTSASEATQHARENAEAVEEVDLDHMSNSELEQKLEQELEEPIAFGDPNQKSGNDKEYYDELAAEADPEVHRSKQAASAKMSATTGVHEEVDEANASKVDSSAPIAKEASVTKDELQRTKVSEKQNESFKTLKEAPQHKVAHVSNSEPTPNKATSGKSNMLLWIALILIGLAIVLWLYNSGTLA